VIDSCVAVFSLSLSSTLLSSSAEPNCNAVALATVVKTTGDVSWSLAAMQAYQTLGCQTPGLGASGCGSSSFYGQSPSPYSGLPAGTYSDGLCVSLYASNELTNALNVIIVGCVCHSATLYDLYVHNSNLNKA